MTNTKTTTNVKKNKKPSAPRNPVARAPIMRKGGVHQGQKSSQRQSGAKASKSESANWRDDVSFEKSLKDQD